MIIRIYKIVSYVLLYKLLVDLILSRSCTQRNVCPKFSQIGFRMTIQSLRTGSHGPWNVLWFAVFEHGDFHTYIYISCYIRTFSIPPTGQQANPKVHYSQVSNVVDAVSGSVTNCTSDRSTSHVYGWFFMKLPRTTYGWPLLETLLHRDIESLERRVEKSTYGSFFRMLERVSKDILYRTYLLRVFAYLFWGCFLLLVIPIKKSRCIH